MGFSFGYESKFPCCNTSKQPSLEGILTMVEKDTIIVNAFVIHCIISSMKSSEHGQGNKKRGIENSQELTLVNIS